MIFSPLDEDIARHQTRGGHPPIDSATPAEAEITKGCGWRVSGITLELENVWQSVCTGHRIRAAEHPKVPNLTD